MLLKSQDSGAASRGAHQIRILMTILVTGGAGFIGANFVLDWLAASNEAVINLDKLTYAGNPETLASLQGDARHQLVQGDIGDSALVSRLLAEHQPRAVVNFAAESHVDRSIRQVTDREPAGPVQAGRIVALLLQFAEKNPGMSRVMIGDALVLEHERLQERINLLFDKVEAQLRQSLKANDSATPTADAQVAASLLVAFMQGRLQRFARSGFKRLPSEHLQAALARML